MLQTEPEPGHHDWSSLEPDTDRSEDRTSAHFGVPGLGEIFDQARYPMVLLGDDRRIRAVNAALVTVLEYSREHLLQIRLDDLLPPDELADLPWRWESLLRRSGGHGSMRLLPRGAPAMLVRLSVTEAVLPGLHLVIVITDDAPGDERCAHGVPILHPLGRGAWPASDMGLSEREQEVLWLVADGATNHQIAYGLGIVEKTVQKHIASVKRKLGASTRAQVVTLALRDGIPDTTMARERTIIHEAIRDTEGRIVDTLIRYISHDSRLELPGIAVQLGRPTSTWYTGWTDMMTFKLFVQALETGREQRFTDTLMQLPWESGPRGVEGRVTPLGPDRGAFVTRKTSSPIT